MTEAQLISKIPRMNRIFVNRSLNLSKIELIGFDMDHTLAPYKKEAFESLAFNETLKKFLEKGYPQELEKLQYKPNFVQRGLLIDRKRGNILKVNGHKYVKTAYHGYEKLSKEQRYHLYNHQSFKAQDFLSIDTFFALSEVQLFLEIVHYMDANPGKIEKNFEEVYLDLRLFIDQCHRDGSIKNTVIKNPEKYIERDKNLAQTLIRLLDGNKSLFLLTNSNFDYTHEIMSFLLSDSHSDFPNWKDYWDIIIVGANKPGFFVHGQPFFEVIEDSNLLKIHHGSFAPYKVYHGGNAKLFEKLTGFGGDQILYVGDHIFGDIIQSKGTNNWRTLLVVEELEEEIPKVQNLAPFIEEVDRALEAKEAMDEKIQRLRSKIAASKRQAIIAQRQQHERKFKLLDSQIQKMVATDLEPKLKELQLLQQNIRDKIAKFEFQIHPQWGQLMKAGLERSRFAHQVASYACLYTSRVSNMRFYSPNKKFLSFHETLPHEE